VQHAAASVLHVPLSRHTRASTLRTQQAACLCKCATIICCPGTCTVLLLLAGHLSLLHDTLCRCYCALSSPARWWVPSTRAAVGRRCTNPSYILPRGCAALLRPGARALREQAQDFRIQYDSIMRLFVLPKNNTPHTLVRLPRTPAPHQIVLLLACRWAAQRCGQSAHASRMTCSAALEQGLGLASLSRGCTRAAKAARERCAQARRSRFRWTRPSARARRTTTTCWSSSPRTRRRPSRWSCPTTCSPPRTKRRA